nr:immunoglobulin light chain junction region [Macaca mulatta]MOW42289.1 immunoglobulin light chain junction region [Macaca mulatta]
CQQHYNYPFTF